MSLPKSFQTPPEYFESCLEFFEEYQHLYNFANTDLLIENVLNQIKIENIGDIDVFDYNFNLRDVKNDYLDDFFQRLDKILPNYDEFIEDKCLKFVLEAPLSLKKKHEILYLANEVQKLCREMNCGTVVDFGSGLGYLDQQLFETTNLNVLGLECNEQHYVSAKKRQRQYHINSIDRIKYIKHRITKESVTNINEYLDDKFPNTQGFCITGLHACADLTVDAVDIFLKMEDARALLIMPCCYHRLQTDYSSFKQFPLSSILKELHEKHGGINYLKVPFLRLATQPHFNLEDQLEGLVFNLLSRAALQLYGWKHNCKLKRKKRKAIRMKEKKNDFETYIFEASKGFSLVNTSKENEVKAEEHFDTEELSLIWRQIDDTIFKKAAIFVMLQNYLQPVFENFVLYDRIVYLQENNIKYCRFKKILDKNISPRCLALIAHK